MQIHDSSLSWFGKVSSVKSCGNYTGLMCPNLQSQKIKLKYRCSSNLSIIIASDKERK